jgi:hypothetical protein
MGGSSWSNDVYTDRQNVRAQNNIPTFQHDDDVRTGKAQIALHPALDPTTMKKGVREARDSMEHPNSVPVICALDQTGSMANVPRIVQANLGKLMSTILTKGYLADPQVLFAAVGDAHTGHSAANREQAPLQVGQFESGLEMEDDLTRIYLEGNGGGQNKESYDLALYFAVHHTVTDAWEKRQRKGYLYIIGDEQTYPTLDAGTIHRIFGGERPSRDFPIKELVEAAQERYHVFFLIPSGASNSARADLHDHWVGLLGAGYVIHLDDPNQVCDVVALTIGLTEGTASPSAATENVTREVKAAMDPILAATKGKVDKAKMDGQKTARI